MRLPRVQFTLRRLIYEVAALAVVLALLRGVGSWLEVEQQRKFYRRQSARYAGWERFWAHDAETLEQWIRESKGAGPTAYAERAAWKPRGAWKREVARYYASLKRKYRSAADHPWLPVAPDPPFPPEPPYPSESEPLQGGPSVVVEPASPAIGGGVRRHTPTPE